MFPGGLDVQISPIELTIQHEQGSPSAAPRTLRILTPDAEARAPTPRPQTPTVMSNLEHLNTSELGTKSYWDAAYTTERQNFSSNPDDEGTIWFSDAGAEERMLAFLENLSDAGQLRKDASSDDTPTRFLDLGTGNGHLLFALREEEWEGQMVGVDYAPQSVRLANEIRDSKGEGYGDIQFHEWDLLGEEPGAWVAGGFDVVLDKGTFDAICLAQETDAQGRRLCEGYREKVEKLITKGGRFLITSCNWTEDEVKGWFDVEGGELVYESKAKYPSFTFGGKTGTSVCTLCFRRKA
ncbi:hypothetical protein EKO04_011190 [Ascochyta lentis]|uniref:Protein-lysine N-methyltransferase EFM4 n=1 Tax=Ascochyta lentis TaxID=205686 RepID=A0A8H7ITX4_9PLEO|nr:hypothetical protein EKO04_011190 [Ascochyta lentis]